MMKKLYLILLMLAFAVVESNAQCSMCRSTLENNLSNGNAGIAAGINMGILYLLVMPYLAAMIIGYLWYKTSKNGR